jgi:ribosomal protein S18 acetylase RimI-like enzyme
LPAFDVRPLDSNDRSWVTRFITEHWGAEFVVAHGEVYYPDKLLGFVAVQDKEKIGLVTYVIVGNSCEIVTLDSLRPSSGIGTALIETVKSKARQAGCNRLWLITTNDNLNGLRFYQKRGFVLVAIHRDAMEATRRLKPVPLIGADGIPLRDEIELEMMLDQPG